MDIYAYIFGFLVALGGLIGFIEEGSLLSLSVGGCFGTLICFGAHRFSSTNSEHRETLEITIWSSHHALH